MACLGASHATLNTPSPEPLPEAKAQDFTGREELQGTQSIGRTMALGCLSGSKCARINMGLTKPKQNPGAMTIARLSHAPMPGLIRPCRLARPQMAKPLLYSCFHPMLKHVSQAFKGAGTHAVQVGAPQKRAFSRAQCSGWLVATCRRVNWCNFNVDSTNNQPTALWSPH